MVSNTTRITISAFRDKSVPSGLHEFLKNLKCNKLEDRIRVVLVGMVGKKGIESCCCKWRVHGLHGRVLCVVKVYRLHPPLFAIRWNVRECCRLESTPLHDLGTGSTVAVRVVAKRGK